MITDVPGLRVGQITDDVGLTGVSVVLCDHPAVCAVERRGNAHDLVGLDYLDPRHIVAEVNGVMLGGGSRFGEEAIYGVLAYLEERGVGFPAGPTVVPHVPGAFLFDLSVGDARARPTRAMGYRAAASAAGGAVSEGSVGAGTGASVGKLYKIGRAMRGGIGTASLRLGDATVGALVAVNALGDVRDPNTGALIAGARDAEDGHRLIDTARELATGVPLRALGAPQHTTIGVVATDARLTKAQAATVAGLGILGFARALSPPHTVVDGDALFVLALGDRGVELTALGLGAAETVARAIVRAVRAATSLPGLPAARDLR